MPPQTPIFTLFVLLLLRLTTALLPRDAVSLLSFKSKADLDNRLIYTVTEPYDYCQWRGVKCGSSGGLRVVRLDLHSTALRGTFPPNSLSLLPHLRSLSLHNNSLSGPVPDLSPLLSLKSLSLSHNSFSGSFPPSLLSLFNLTVIDFSFNNFSGPIPVNLTRLDRLVSLRLDSNWFDQALPPLNQSTLVYFNVSRNNLTGLVPLTSTLSRFGSSAFRSNPGLCGEIVNRPCGDKQQERPPFFGNNASSPVAPLSQSAQANGGGGGDGRLAPPLPPPSREHKRRGVVFFGFVVGVSVLVLLVLSMFFVFVKKQRNERGGKQNFHQQADLSQSLDPNFARGTRSGDNAEATNPKMKQLVQTQSQGRADRSGCLVFSEGEAALYTMEQLMRASAELLGRGSIGTTYKAVLDNRLILTVKRLDASKTAITSSELFEKHMSLVGAFRHPKLVPVRAYFQAKGERLVIYDYQPNGSLFNLVHGSRSARAKPLHWTSCLKIAEDVAQGLAYIHQESKLVHGNLKSSNVLLGADFEACVTDYCLSVLAETSLGEDPDSAARKAPETHKSSRRATTKSDVYAFGILLLELLTGKHPSQHPYLAPDDMLNWVRTMRENDDVEDNQLGMLAEVASICSLTSPEQRPAMWQVLKMIQEIKDSVTIEENAAIGYS